MAGPIFSGRAGNRLAKALASSGQGVDLDTASTLLNFDYLKSKMAGQQYEDQVHQASARKTGAEAALKELELANYRNAPGALEENAALTAGVTVPQIQAYRTAMSNPEALYEPAPGGVGPPAPRTEAARSIESTPPLGVQRGLGEMLRALSSTKPNAADDLARSAEQGAVAQRTGLGTDAAVAGDTELVTNLRELTHNPAAEASEKGQLSVVHGLLKDLKIDAASDQGKKILRGLLDKITARPDTASRLEQLREQAMLTFPGNTPEMIEKREKEIWRGLVAELDPIKAFIRDTLQNPGAPSPSPGAAEKPASPAASNLRPGEVSGKVKQQPMYAVNPKTKARIVSTDGGQTWQPAK